MKKEKEIISVTTIRGDLEPRNNCKYIKGAYYKIDRDCFNINNMWYRYNSDKIIFDHETKVYLLKNTYKLHQGICGFKNGKPEIGYFTKNPYNNVHVRTDLGVQLCINEKILIENGFFESLQDNTWYKKSTIPESAYKQMTKICHNQDFLNKGYNIEDNNVEFPQKKLLYEMYNITLSREVREYAKFIGDITWGIEVETKIGSLPKHIENRLGIVACRDGSLDGGGEFVSVPLSGAKGLQNMKNISEELSKRTNIDINCSYHIHLGNIRKDREFIVALYMLCYKIQDEMFKMFPFYKTKPEGFKKKNYCKKLNKMGMHPIITANKEEYKEFIDSYYMKIFNFLSCGILPGADCNKKLLKHPIPHKWDRKSRYFYCNLENMIFSKRGTFESRLHDGTTNFQKMINWFFINVAIIRYTEKNLFKILSSKDKIPVQEIFNYYKDNFRDEKAAFLSRYLTQYYKERCKYFQRYYEEGDYLCGDNILKDKNYKFTFEKVTNLF